MPWSYSALTAYETCPRRYWHTRVAKDVIEPETQALTWGNAVHKALELRAKENKPLPTGMEHWEPLIAKIIGAGGVWRAGAQGRDCAKSGAVLYPGLSQPPGSV